MRAATGSRLPRPCAQRTASPRPPGGGGFAPTGAGAVRARTFAVAETPLACARASANRTGERSTGPFPAGPLGRETGAGWQGGGVRHTTTPSAFAPRSALRFLASRSMQAILTATPIST